MLLCFQPLTDPTRTPPWPVFWAGGSWGTQVPDLKERGRVIGTSYVYIQYTCFLLNCRSVFLHLFLLNQEASCSLLLD